MGSAQNQPPRRRRTSPSASEVVQRPHRDLAAEHVLDVRRGERHLGRRAGEVRREDVRVRRVEHAALQGRAEHGLRVVHEEGVQRIVAGHEQHQRVVARAPGTPRLLPERRPRPGEPRDHHRVEPGDVDPQLQRVRRRDPAQRAAHQRRLELAALLGQEPGAVGRDLAGELRVDLGEHPPRAQRGQLRTPPRAHERQRPRPLDDEVGQDPGRLRPRRPAHRGAVLAGHLLEQRRLPQPDRPAPARRGVVGDLDDVEAGERGRRDRRVGHRRRGQHERRAGAVARTDPSQPAQQQRDVRAEHPAVGVRLVDDDVAQPAQERRPATVPRQDPAVEHVGVGEHPPCRAPHRVPLGVRGVPVVRRGA